MYICELERLFGLVNDNVTVCANGIVENSGTINGDITVQDGGEYVNNDTVTGDIIYN